MSLSSVRDLFASQSRFISLTYLVPPLGVYAIAGCGGDLLINIVLTILGYALRLPHNSLLTSGTFVKHSTAADNSDLREQIYSWSPACVLSSLRPV